MKEHLLDDLRLRKERAIYYNDPVAWIRERGVIHHYNRGVIKFSPTVEQVKLLRTYHNGNTIVNGARQCGVTVTTSMYLLWYAMHNSNSNIGIITNKQLMSNMNLDIIRMAYDCLPVWLKDSNPLTQNSKTSMGFANGTQIHSLPGTADRLRGISYSLVHLDNCDCLSDRKQDEILSTLLPQMIPKKDSRILITSTVVKSNSPFYKIYTLAVSGLGDFVPIEIRIDVNKI